MSGCLRIMCRWLSVCADVFRFGICECEYLGGMCVNVVSFNGVVVIVGVS